MESSNRFRDISDLMGQRWSVSWGACGERRERAVRKWCWVIIMMGKSYITIACHMPK